MNLSLKTAPAFLGYLLGSFVIMITFIIEKMIIPAPLSQAERQVKKA